MSKVGFKMKLKKGFESEYKKRHDEIWPELVSLLKNAGISDYSIFLDQDSLTLFAVQKLAEDHKTLDLPNHPIMQKWWAYMSDIMETNPDHSPVVRPLEEVFYLG